MKTINLPIEVKKVNINLVARPQEEMDDNENVFSLIEDDVVFSTGGENIKAHVRYIKVDSSKACEVYVTSIGRGHKNEPLESNSVINKYLERELEKYVLEKTISKA